jgi:aldose 1-epimerase
MRIVLIALSIAGLSSCFLQQQKDEKTMDKKEAAAPFESSIDGKQTSLFTLKNAKGMEVQLTNYGASIVSIRVPDKKGVTEDVVLGYDSIQGFVNGKSYFGCVAGRYANRIAGAKFSLNGNSYSLAANNGVNSLHGGMKGFDKRVWDGTQSANSVTFTYTSSDGEEGYPGTLTVTLTYRLDSNENRLQLTYAATTDKETILNLANHSYFNLEGQGKGTILDHEIMINAPAFTPVDSTLIPTGVLQNVSGTAFDFTKPLRIGARINDTTDPQIRYGLGYDHNFVLPLSKSGGLQLAAKVSAPISGRTMEVLTTEPGVQFYTGNFLDGSEKGKGSVYGHRSGFCLETQHFPDSPNQPAFPSTVLKPGQQFQSTTVFVFGIQ